MLNGSGRELSPKQHQRIHSLEPPSHGQGGINAKKLILNSARGAGASQGANTDRDHHSNDPMNGAKIKQAYQQFLNPPQGLNSTRKSRGRDNRPHQSVEPPSIHAQS